MYLSLCVRVCVRACVCMHLCSAGPEVAVLDWYGPVADPVAGYWLRVGGGGRTPGSMRSTHSRGQSLAASLPEFLGGFQTLLY